MKPQVKIDVYDNGKYVRTVPVAPATAQRLTKQSPEKYRIKADDDIGITVETKVIQKKSASPVDTKAEVVTKRIVLPEKEKVEDTKEAPAEEKPAEKPKEVKQEKTKKTEAKKSKKTSKKKTTSKKVSKKTNKKTRK